MRTGFLTIALAIGATVGAASTTAAQTFAITNARIHTVSGSVIERGTIIVQNGRITAVGTNVTIPSGVQSIDATGKVVTPGLFDSHTGLGTVEIGAAAGSNDMSSATDHITAAFNPLDNLNPFATSIAITRNEGITRAVVAPSAGASFIAGQGLIVDLADAGSSLTVHRNPVAIYANLGENGAERTGGARAANLLNLREVLQDARDYSTNRAAFDAGSRREYAASRLDLEALGPVVRGEIPLIVSVNRASDILGALRFAREMNIKIILEGAAEGWMVAQEIARTNVPVITNPLTNIPSFDALGITLENATRLHAAGVTVAFASFDTHNSRNLKQFAGNAVAHGMPFDAALRAITLTPARIFGLADRYGSIEAGKDADLVIWSGDPLELMTAVERVFIRGSEVRNNDRQKLLLERYRTIR